MLRRRHERVVAVIIASVVLTVAACVGWVLSRRVPQQSGPMPHHAYVWQRRWDKTLMAGIERAAAPLDRITILAAEVDWEGSDPKIVRTRIDYATLRATGKPIGFAIRVNPYPGPFFSDDAAADALAQLARAILREAEAERISTSEIQIDFDAATSKLADYAHWVTRLEREVEPVPLVITTLPTWLSSPDFVPLVQKTDGFVLQVHAIVKPQSAKARISVFNPVRAKQWVKKAGRTGAPFRVALPTYSYRAGFAADGTYLGVVAEGPEPTWPAGHTVLDIHSDARDAAKLVRTWTTSRPLNMQGVIWFRVPIDSDRRNWRYPTLEAVVAGQTPQPEAAAEVSLAQTGEHVVELINRGAGEVSLGDVLVQLRWSGAPPVAAETDGGFLLGDDDDAGIVLLVDEYHANGRLRAHERMVIARLRFEQPAEITAELQSLAK